MIYIPVTKNSEPNGTGASVLPAYGACNNKHDRETSVIQYEKTEERPLSAGCPARRFYEEREFK